MRAKKKVRPLVLAVLVLGCLPAFAGTARAADFTRTTISRCSSVPVPRLGSFSFCTATVEDTFEPSRSPTGQVEFRSNRNGEFFSPQTASNRCVLAAVRAGVSTCEIAYKPLETGPEAKHTLTAEYLGDSRAGKSSGQRTIELAHPTTTSLLCGSGATRTQPVSCEAQVSDQISAVFPTGTVRTTVPNVGVKTCTLTPFFGTTSVCSFSFTPALQGDKKEVLPLSAEYVADESHELSSGSTSVTIRGVSKSSVACQPAPQFVLGGIASCKISVEGPAGETPHGTASLKSSAAGTFPDGSSTCSLVATTANTAACTVRFQPGVTGHPTITASFPGEGSLDPSSGTTTFEVIRESKTVLSCLPSDLAPGATSSCVVTVEDPLGGPPAEARPTGEVTFSSNRSGTFSATKCTLAAAGAATCEVAYASGGVSEPTIVASYPGDANHLPSQQSVTLVVHRHTTTGVSCAPSAIDVHAQTTCTALVVDGSPQSIHPEGRVDFFNEGAGTFVGGSSCTLAALAAAGASSCSVSYEPTRIESARHRISAVYAGQTGVDSSQGAAVVGVGNATTTALSCSEVVASGAAARCVASVVDESANPKPVTGAVSFGHTGSGGFTPASTCVLTEVGGLASCEVHYTPQGTGATTQEVTAHYGGDDAHGFSDDSTSLRVLPGKHGSATNLECNPHPVERLTVTHCLVTVTDSVASEPTPPAGEVTFASDGPGTFSVAGTDGVTTCELTAAGPAGSSCSFDYTPTKLAGGIHHLTALYAGGPAHTGSEDELDLTVTGVEPHPTTTTLTCAPAPVATAHASHCTATVADTGPGATTPRGTVRFSSSSTHGSFDSRSCDLAGTGGSASCGVDYTPSEVDTGTHTIAASYQPGSEHESSVDLFDLDVVRNPTTTTLNCRPAAVVLGAASVCTVTVEDTGPAGGGAPGGEVVFQRTGPGSFSHGGACIVFQISPSAGRCQVLYTPSEIGSGTHAVRASYAGDVRHEPSGDERPLTVTAPGPGAHPTSLALECRPSTVFLDGAAVCTAIVTDTADQGTRSPRGSVSFASDSPGTFEPAACTLFAVAPTESRCQVIYEPAADQGAPHGITAIYAGEPSGADQPAHKPSLGATAIVVDGEPAGSHSTEAGLVCDPDAAEVGIAMACTATVENTDGSPVAPSGTILLSSDGPGSFGLGGCLLAPTAPGKASCAIAYVGLAAGEPQLTVVYGGDSGSGGVDSHGPSTAVQKVTVTPTTPPPPPPAPTVTGLAPDHGAAAGGEVVTVTGTELGGATAVDFGAVRATDLTVVDATTLTATAPAGTAGATVDVTVTTPGGTSQTTAADRYAYDAVPPPGPGPGGGPGGGGGPGSGGAGGGAAAGSGNAAAGEQPKLAPPGPPDTTIKKKPHKQTKERQAMFRFVSDQPGSTFQCKLDRKPFRACRSPFKVKKLKLGRHVLRVRAVSPQGLVDPTPANFRWKIRP